jgi:hypothetical protein
VLSGGGLWFDTLVDEQLTKLYCRLAVVPYFEIAFRLKEVEVPQPISRPGMTRSIPT